MQAPLPQPARGITGSLTDGTAVDISLSADADGVVRVAQIRPVDLSGNGIGITGDAGWLDLRGFVLTAAPAEPHAHLDKAMSWAELQPPLGDLKDAITSWQTGSTRLGEESFRRRAMQAASAMLRNGITAVRTHVNVLPDDDPLRAVRVLAEMRDALRGLVTVQIVVLPGSETPTAEIERALDAGADLIGGSPHTANDPIREVTRLLDMAEKRGVGADLHIDEFMEGDHLTIEAYADRVVDWPRDRIRTASHCSRLATLPSADLHRVASALARAGVSVIALPITNLYLQGRQGNSTGRRGITTIDVLRDAGVLVAGGADNIRDPFNPVGRADPLETASLLITAAHQTPDAAIDLVTNAARAVMGLEPAGPQIGARADFLAVRGSDVVSAIAVAPADRVVIVNGAPVARTETTSWTALPTETTYPPPRRPIPCCPIPGCPIPGCLSHGGSMSSAESPARSGIGHPLVGFEGADLTFPDGTHALRDVSLTVGEGEFVSVVGPSGCGKSTLLRLAAGLEKITDGDMHCAASRIGYVFQDATLLPWRSVKDNVALFGELDGVSKDERQQRVAAALSTVGLDGFENHLPHMLSGGMRMRVSLARSLTLDPDLFLFDEPFAALDEITRERLGVELNELFAVKAFAGLFITHSVTEAAFLSTRVLVMSGRPGTIVDEVEVPFPYPRSTDLRFEPEFGEIAGRISRALREAHS